MQVTSGQQVPSSPSHPLQYCSFYKIPPNRVEKIKRPLWLCVNYFKKWLHVPLIKCWLKPIRFQGAQKQRRHLRRKHRRKCNLNKERYRMSQYILPTCVELGHLYINSVYFTFFPCCRTKHPVCCHHTSVGFHDTTLEGFRDRRDSPVLRRRTNLCTVLYGDDSVPLVMRSSPALSITLHHGPLLHQGGTVSEAISW